MKLLITQLNLHSVILRDQFLKLNLTQYLCAFEWSRKAPLPFITFIPLYTCLSVRLSLHRSVHVYQSVSQWTDFHEI
jgi:hypothetical protein